MNNINRLSTSSRAHTYLAEFLGTFFLAISVYILTAFSAANYAFESFSGLFVPFGVGLTLFVLVVTLASKSGAHFNPAITLAAALFKHMQPRQAFNYILAQIAGAYIAVWACLALIPSGLVQPSGQITAGGVLAEFLGTLFFVFTVFMVILKQTRAELGALAIGAALAVGAAIALPYQGGILNPAIALAAGGFSWRFLLIPILGGICGAAFAILLTSPEPESNS